MNRKQRDDRRKYLTKGQKARARKNKGLSRKRTHSENQTFWNRLKARLKRKK